MKVGALFAGYGGLEQGLARVLPAEPAWFSEVEPAPCAILAHRYPGVPNLGDITKVGWSAVEPVDVITGGSPCQDLSHAGKRLGMKPGTRSGLWAAMCDAVDILRPRLVLWENVRYDPERVARDVLAALDPIGYALVHPVRRNIWMEPNSGRRHQPTGGFIRCALVPVGDAEREVPE